MTMVRASRCKWVNLKNPLYVKYHDEEWGVPSRDDAYLYEMLLLEMFVAGLSWECVLNKRESFRAAFAGFHPQAVAAFGEGEVAALLQNPGIIRHRGKIEAAIANSRIFLQIQAECGSFATYAWDSPTTKWCTNPTHCAPPLHYRMRFPVTCGAAVCGSSVRLLPTPGCRL